MMRSLFSGVSGLKNHQTRMDVIGNNISNINTTGYKSSRATFSDMLSQTLTGASAPSDKLGGTNPKQIGLGSSVASIDMLFTDGSVQTTGKNTDLCLSGNGLFVVSDGGQKYYTRNGNFIFDADGNYVQPGNGLYVQGWMAKDGNLSTNGETTKIQIPAGKTMGAKPSAIAAYSNNLNSEAATIKKLSGGTVTFSRVTYTNKSDGSMTASVEFPVKLTLSDGSTVEVTEKTYTVGDKYSSVPKKYTAANDEVTVTAENGPVTVELKNTKTATPSEVDASWRYGYQMAGPGDKFVATDAVQVEVIGTDGTTTAKVNTGETVTVGEKYQTKEDRRPIEVTATVAAPLRLYFVDGTYCDNVQDGKKYMPGRDTYKYPGTGVDKMIRGISKNFVVGKINVLSEGGGEGASVKVGGFAEHTVNTVGTSILDDANNEVILKLENGKTVNGVDGTTYTVGDVYETAKETVVGTVSEPATATNGVKLDLGGGITHVDNVTGNTYKVGETYTLTVGGVTQTYTVQGFSYLSKITSLTEKSDIVSITEQQPINVTEMEQKKESAWMASKDKPVTVAMTDGSVYTVTSGRYELGHTLPLTTTLTLYDSLGAKHDVMLYFTKTKTDSVNGNQWTVSVNTSGLEETEIKEANGSVTKVAMKDSTLQFTTEGAFADGAGKVNLTLTNGAIGSQTVSVDLSALTQYAGANTVAGKADGNAAGTLASVAVDQTGIITGTYTNGVKQVEAQVAVAQFNNAAALTKRGDSLYQESNNSGVANIKTVVDLGCKITPSALEMSNVDVANEFTDMIVTQRGFQSNSKIITVSDEMLETLINMKR